MRNPFKIWKQRGETIEALGIKLKMQEKRIKELEDFMVMAKPKVVEQNLGIDKKKKWLNSYPDQTNQKEV